MTISGRFLDPLGNAVHTALAFDVIGEDVLITGAGPIGIMAAAVARHVGARHVVITDINPDRLALAEKVVDLVPVNTAKESLKDVMHRLRMTEGFDVGLEMSGCRPGLRPDDRYHGYGRQYCHAGTAAATIDGRLGEDCL